MNPHVSRIANVVVPSPTRIARCSSTPRRSASRSASTCRWAEAGRWIEVAPSGADTPIAICPPGPSVTVGGKDTGVSLQTDDIDAYHAELKGRGVDVDAEVSRFGDSFRRCSGCATPRATR